MKPTDISNITLHYREQEFPRPKFPLFPVLSLGTFFKANNCNFPSVREAGSILCVTTGRMGLSLALEHMDIKNGEKVLIPAYHCNSMVEPVVNASGVPVFYRIREDTSVDLDDIRTRLDDKTRALMVTHYFGFPQNLVEIREFCDAHKLILIEDCAHVFFGDYAGRPLGSYGDYAFASPMKFFPTYDGGYLLSSKHSLEKIPLKSPGGLFSVKAIFTILERSLMFDRFSLLKPIIAIPIYLKNILRSLFKSTPPVVGTESEEQKPRYDFAGYFSGLPGEFDAAWIHTRMSLTSRILIKVASKSRVSKRRRMNYVRLYNELSELPRCKPLYQTLPETVVPYVFPLLVEEPERVFPALKRQGVPISRFGEYLWRGFEPSICPMAVEFSRCVLQFPCHQELTTNELTWMINKIKEVMLEQR